MTNSTWKELRGILAIVALVTAPLWYEIGVVESRSQERDAQLRQVLAELSAKVDRVLLLVEGKQPQIEDATTAKPITRATDPVDSE